MRTSSIGIRLGSTLSLALGVLAACGGTGGGSGGGSDGGGGAVLASSFNQSCSEASDCVPVSSGTVTCCGSDGCDNAAINKSDEAKYEAAVMAATAQLDCTGTACPAIACALPTVACKAGKCTVVPYGSDAGSDSGFDAGRVPCGKTTCAPGDVCVSNQTEGGALNPPNDAGACPDGDVLSGGSCEPAPTYQCAKAPASCSTGFSCACAQSLCDPSHMCTEAKDSLVQCIEDAP